MASSESIDTDDPVGYFLDDMGYHGKSERTREAYERVLRQFEAHLDAEGMTPSDAGQRDCLAFIHSLRGDVGASTIATYASYLHRFYGYMVQIGAFDANPMGLVVEELDETIETDPARRDISIDRMRGFVDGITHPLERAFVITLLKTGIRVGEACNLDLRDLNLDGTVAAAFDTTPRAQIDDRPYSLFVDDAVRRGDEVNGELRMESNKRKRQTVIPVDDELDHALHRWLAIRPDARSPAEPLFTSTKDGWGDRLTPEMARAIVRRHAKAAGWYQEGGGPSENVTPHYFRHFFTTHLRDRTGDRGVVKYLRGDVADDVIDTYTHNWGDRVREVYDANIYSLS